MLINETVLREQIWSGPEPFGNCSVRTWPKTLFVSLGGGWALREETKKASCFDDKKTVYLENKVHIGHSSRRKVDAEAVPWDEISRIARFRGSA